VEHRAVWLVSRIAAGVGRHLVMSERTDGKNKKELSSFIDSILIKDNVKDTLWIKDKVNWSLY